MTPGELYSQGTNVEDQVDQLGVMTMLRLDIKHSLFGVKKKADLEDDFSDLKEVLNQTGEELSESGSGEEPKKPVDTSPNVMDIDFDTLIAGARSDDEKWLSKYFQKHGSYQ